MDLAANATCKLKKHETNIAGELEIDSSSLALLFACIAIVLHVRHSVSVVAFDLVQHNLIQDSIRGKSL